jgi:hypothetical protein
MLRSWVMMTVWLSPSIGCEGESAMALKMLPKGLGLDPSAVHSSRLTVESCSLNNLYIRICSIRTKNGGKRETPFSLSSRILRRSWQSSVFPLLIAPCCGCSSHVAVPWTLVQIGSRSLFRKHKETDRLFPMPYHSPAA